MIKTATVICAKCSKTGKLFGIRTEKQKSKWIFTWSFKLSSQTASNERYDETVINDCIDTSEKYPGCPYCGTKKFIQCNCGKINCYDGNSEKMTCRFCGLEGIVTSGPWNAVSGGGY